MIFQFLVAKKKEWVLNSDGSQIYPSQGHNDVITRKSFDIPEISNVHQIFTMGIYVSK